jgi:thioredoxin reductase
MQSYQAIRVELRLLRKSCNIKKHMIEKHSISWRKLKMLYDVAIVGGSFAGLSAAMMLARGRRSVCVIDSGEPRNRFADASHGFFGQDGTPPLELMRLGQQKLLAYPNVCFHSDQVMDVQRLDGGAFRIDLAAGESLFAKKIILATGVKDSLPPLAGLQQRWGKTVLHCPYCHGYEFDGNALGVLQVTPMSAHQALLIPEWGPTTFFLNGDPLPDSETLQKLKARGVTLEPGKIVQLLGDAPALNGVQLEDGRIIPVVAMYVASQAKVQPLIEKIGCETEDSPLGQQIKVDESKQTSIPGIYAAGDHTRLPHNATLASADGVMTGTFVHRALIFETLENVS